MRVLDGATLGTKSLFAEEVDNDCLIDSSRWIAFHGTTEYHIDSIQVEGLKPWKCIKSNQLESLRRISAALNLQSEFSKVETFFGLQNINLYPTSQLALHHARSKGGQGLRFSILPLLREIEQHADFSNWATEYGDLGNVVSTANATQAARPAVIAVDIKQLPDKSFYRTALAIQIKGIIKRDNLVDHTVVDNVIPYSDQDLRDLRRYAVQLRELPKSTHYLKAIDCIEESETEIDGTAVSTRQIHRVPEKS